MLDNEIIIDDVFIFDDLVDDKKIKVKPEKQKSIRSGHVSMFERQTKNVYRRAFSETQLLDIFKGEEFKKDHSYHCISAGDVDSLSYLKIILRQQDLDYCLASTWCMALDDILQIEEWLKDGKIKRLDFYMGEIFKGSYSKEYEKFKEVFDKYKCGRIAIFRNHSKIYAGYGKEFHFAIESSANINTNPRTENTTITIDEGLYGFYKNYFDKIVSFDKQQ